MAGAFGVERVVILIGNSDFFRALVECMLHFPGAIAASCFK